MSRWTIRELNETDTLTFAMIILSDRRMGLNQEAPLAKKIGQVYKELEELRDLVRQDAKYAPEALTLKDAIHDAVEHEMLRIDIKTVLRENPTWLCGYSHKQIYKNSEMMDQIIRRYDGYYDSDLGHWSNVERAVEDGIADVIERRKS